MKKVILKFGDFDAAVGGIFACDEWKGPCDKGIALFKLPCHHSSHAKTDAEACQTLPEPAASPLPSRP